MLPLLALLAELAAPAGGEATFVAVLPVQSRSGLSEDRSGLVLETVREGAASDALIVVPQEHVRNGLAALGGGCGTPGECQEALADRIDARFLFQVEVEEPSPQDFDVVVRVLEPATGGVIAEHRESCKICSEADLERVVRERTLDARSALERHLHPEEDADEPAPVAPAPAPETRVEVRVEKGSPLVPTGAGLLGGGAAATLGGVVLLALTGSDAGCPPDPRGGGCLPLVYETLVPGVIVAGVGVALVATGAALLAVGKKKDARGTAARLQPGLRGLTVRF
jgi:hypothetical protein